MSVRDAVRRWDAAHGADDVPLWAEVLGAGLAIGLLVRAGSHVWAALLAGVDPRLDGHDVAARNVVPAARDAPAVDLAGRLLAFAFGVGMLVLLDPVGVGYGGPEWLTLGGRALVLLNVAVLVGDPVLFAVDRLRLR